MRLPAHQARQLVRAVRSKDYFLNTGANRCKIYAMLQKPREIRERNKLLMGIAYYVQSQLRDQTKVQENWRCVCWRSASVVVAGKKICSVYDKNITLTDDWWSDTVCLTNHAAMAEAILNCG